MPTNEQWRDICEQLKDDPRGRVFGRFYREFAMADFPRKAVSMIRKGALSSDWQEDLLHEVVGNPSKMKKILGATSPRAMYRTIVCNLVIDWVALAANQLDPRDERSTRQNPSGEVPEVGGRLGPDQGLCERMDAARFLALCSPRDRDVLLAVQAIEDREEVARQFGTTRANVDQIVSRVRSEYRAWQAAQTP